MSDFTKPLVAIIETLLALQDNARIDALNDIRAALHEVSPLKHHPVDFVRWVRAEDVQANNHNPNFVASPEFKLLTHSIDANGYTMPIVANREDDAFVIVDGFHRNRVGKEVAEIYASTCGRLPLTQIRQDRSDRMSRIAATVEHNRARGEHQVEAMSELVRELYQAGWRDDKIQEELGMDVDELRRLKQITGLAELFAARDFSEAWEPLES